MLKSRQNWPFKKSCKIEGKGRSNQKNSKLESTLELPPGSQKIFEKVSRRNFIHAHRKKTSLREQMNVHRIKICSEFYVLNVPGSGQRHCRQRHAVLLCIVPSCRWIGARLLEFVPCKRCPGAPQRRHVIQKAAVWGSCSHTQSIHMLSDLPCPPSSKAFWTKLEYPMFSLSFIFESNYDKFKSFVQGLEKPVSTPFLGISILIQKKTAAFIRSSVTLVPRQPLGWHGRSTGERSSFMAEKLKCSQGEKVSLAANWWFFQLAPKLSLLKKMFFFVFFWIPIIILWAAAEHEFLTSEVISMAISWPCFRLLTGVAYVSW